MKLYEVDLLSSAYIGDTTAQHSVLHASRQAFRAAGRWALENEETMTQEEVEAFVTELENVQREENFGYSFFFVGDDHRLSFVTIANSDNDYDNVSNLNRDGVFRINIGVSRETFKKLIGGPSSELVDYTVLDTFLPHPEYSRQHFVCILNPSNENVQTTKKLIVEAHSIATARLQRKRK